jgi:hypothetical protein
MPKLRRVGPLRQRKSYYLKPIPMRTFAQRGVELIRDQVGIILKLFRDPSFQ